MNTPQHLPQIWILREVKPANMIVLSRFKIMHLKDNGELVAFRVANEEKYRYRIDSDNRLVIDGTKMFFHIEDIGPDQLVLSSPYQDIKIEWIYQRLGTSHGPGFNKYIMSSHWTSWNHGIYQEINFEWKEDQAIFKFHSEENGLEQVYCQVVAYEDQYFLIPTGENAILEDNNFIIGIEGDKLRISLQLLGHFADFGSRRELDFYER
jgi:hypothetical protein